jgi:hypothetical protein
MSTNYYAKIIPSKERKKELHDAIEANDFPLINKLMDEMYNPIRVEYGKGHIIGGVVHLGKRSDGWKFLWNPNVSVIRKGHLEDSPTGRRYIPDPSIPKYLYPLTKKGLKSFIDREDVLIYDEYDELQDKEEFWKMALGWTTWKDHKTGKTIEAWDGGSYEREHPTENRWVNNTDLTKLLEAEGYEFTSYTKSDFYSDGLRFSTNTDFS